MLDLHIVNSETLRHTGTLKASEKLKVVMSGVSGTILGYNVLFVNVIMPETAWLGNGIIRPTRNILHIRTTKPKYPTDCIVTRKLKCVDSKTSTTRPICKWLLDRIALPRLMESAVAATESGFAVPSAGGSVSMYAAVLTGVDIPRHPTSVAGAKGST